VAEGGTVTACRYCRAHLDAYVAGELALPARRRVAAHLDQCAACYAVYAQRREVVRELQRSLPMVGYANPPDFGQVWLNVQQEMPRGSGYSIQYGLAALLLLVLLLVPFTMGHRDIAAALPTQPAPHQLDGDQTPDRAGARAKAVTTAPRTATLSPPAFGTPPTMPEPSMYVSSRGFDDRND